jgi:nucleotide-binding universal stress UspA family protein
MKVILFPTDFSENATHAAKYAGILAKQLDAQVVLLHIYSIPTISEYQLPRDIENFIWQKEKEAKKDLKEYADIFSKSSGLLETKISQRIEYGIISDRITEAAHAVHADMIVMGTKGANNLFDKWIGTNAQKVTKEAHCPVWVIPQTAHIHFPKNILYAADFNDDEILATQKLLEITHPLGSVCKVVHINEYFEINIAHHAEETAEMLAEEFEEENLKVKNLNRTDVVKGLEKYIKTQKPDVLAFAIHEKSFFRDLFNTSVTKHFVQESQLPILVFRK